MTVTHETAKRMIDEMLQLEEGLSDWEVDFLERVGKEIETKEARGGFLTTRQRDKIEGIWNQRIGNK